MQDIEVQHVFLVGAKSLGVYGGFETFVNKLTEYHQNNKKIIYHVACKANSNGSMDPYTTAGAVIISEREFIYHNAHCFRIKVPQKLGSAQAIYYDVASLNECCKIISRENIHQPIVYILACRIGPFMRHFFKKIHKLGGVVYLNPDGHEFLRTKWSSVIQKYWKASERMMVKYSDLVICDSLAIEKYIHECYDGNGINGSNPKTVFIAYGAETRKSKLSDNSSKLMAWYHDKGLSSNNYYLVVGRFVPENNYETIIGEFMKSSSKRNLAIITNTNKKFLDELEKTLHFSRDARIKFVGTVYDEDLLMKIREHAYGYLHGHEVGGTNPSLLEALSRTKLNLLLNVSFNKEVAEDAALYWTKKDGNLMSLIERADTLSEEELEEFGTKAKQRIHTYYNWPVICDRYADVFLTNDVDKRK